MAGALQVRHDASVMRPLTTLMLVLFGACRPGPIADLDVSTGAARGSCACSAWTGPHEVGRVASPVDELSGLTVSRAQPGVFFAHNDSGDEARFFALDHSGAVLQTFSLPGATAIDWEDVASSPCPSGTCLLWADSGDNALNRPDYALYRVEEPRVPNVSNEVSWDRFSFVYPGNQSHNAEALVVDPSNGRPYVITKVSEGPSEVFRFPLPLDATQTVVLEPVASLQIPQATDRPVTAADVNSCGTAMLVRTYNRLVEFRLPDGEDRFDRLFDGVGRTVPSAIELQGESVAYGPDGVSYFTSSEKILDERPPLSEVHCR